MTALPQLQERPRHPHRWLGVLLAAGTVPLLLLALMLGLWWVVASMLMLLAQAIHSFFRADESEAPASRGLNHVIAVPGTFVALICGVLLGKLLVMSGYEIVPTLEAVSVVVGVAFVAGTLGWYLLLPRIRRAA